MKATSKYADWTRGQIEALINILGEENARMLLAGEISVEFKELIQKLFDKHSNRIPPKGLKANVCNLNQDYRLDRPKLNEEVSFANRIRQLHESLGINTGISGAYLQQEYQRLRSAIAEIPGAANILKGICLPVILVRRHSNDIGEDMEWQLEGVGRSYVDAFNNRSFYNHRKGELAGQVEIVKEGGYRNIWDRKEKENVIALFFPNPLQGFSIFAQREQMTTIPKGFVLSGALEPMVMYPDILARGYKTPGLDLSALSWKSSDYSLCFKANDDELFFGGTVLLSHALDYYSGSLLFLG